MIIKNIIDEDFTNYKECSMFIGFPTCTFKCEKECGCKGMCQNSELVKAPNIEVSPEIIVKRYLSNPLSRAMVIGGLEPFDSYPQLLELLNEFRKYTEQEFIIYTGYTKDEIFPLLDDLNIYKNVIIKFGRFIPNQEKHYDEVLQIYLASDNQYAEKIS